MPEMTRFGAGKASNNIGGDGVTWFNIGLSCNTGPARIMSLGTFRVFKTMREDKQKIFSRRNQAPYLVEICS